MKLQEFRPLVWEYMIEDGTCLSVDNNRSYLKKYEQLVQKYKELLKLPANIGITII